MLRAEGEAQAIGTVFNAIHAGQPDQALLSYQYLQMLPQLAKGDANKMWIVPSELNDALKGLGGVVNQAMGGSAGAPGNGIPAATGSFTAPPKIDVQAEIEQQSREDEEASRKTVAEAIAAAQELDRPGIRPHASRNGAPAVTDGRDDSAAPSGQDAATSTVTSTEPDSVEEAATVTR
jgi:hypothetical protein